MSTKWWKMMPWAALKISRTVGIDICQKKKVNSGHFYTAPWCTVPCHGIRWKAARASKLAMAAAGTLQQRTLGAGRGLWGCAFQIATYFIKKRKKWWFIATHQNEFTDLRGSNYIYIYIYVQTDKRVLCPFLHKVRCSCKNPEKKPWHLQYIA